jgi:hypothetical protein
MRHDSSAFTSRCRLVDTSVYAIVTVSVGTGYFEWRIPLEINIFDGRVLVFRLNQIHQIPSRHQHPLSAEPWPFACFLRSFPSSCSLRVAQIQPSC